MDGTIPRGSEPPLTMQAVVIGGVANGMIIKSMLADAERIELAAPDYVKPLAYSKQETADVEMKRDVYEVCTIFLSGSQGAPIPFGLCVLTGRSLAWAFSEMVKGFAKNVINELSAENLKQ